MEATFATAAAFQSIVGALRGLLTHATFDCDAHGMRLHSLDAERVALADLRLRRAGFARYACERKLSFSVPVRGLVKIVRTADPSAPLTMRVAARDDRVRLAYETARRAVSCTLAQISLDADRLGVPDKEYTCVLAVPSAELTRACADLARLGATTVEMSSGATGLSFAAHADDGVRVRVLLRGSPQRPLTQAFACCYLNKLARASALSETVDVCMDASMPLRLRFRLGPLGALDLYLAPRVPSVGESAQ
ncbi:proliferating cell nuclear antigen [Dasychira pudibunda nucleopolyhedrovirus]|nr:proliferating cell nuclear antigen [Dasychira pudibunda nucleopolyhedrovirus]WHM28408.1 pcna [Dasychira pudibunda nucleopolyhedrovirus]